MVSEYISKSVFIEELQKRIGGDLDIDDVEYLEKIINGIPTLDEKEIIRKPFERVVERLEELKNDCDCYGHLKKKGLVDWTIKIVKEECGLNE